MASPELPLPEEPEPKLIETLPSKLGLAERFGDPAVQASVVLNLPLPEIARVYNLPPHRNGAAGAGA